MKAGEKLGRDDALPNNALPTTYIATIDRKIAR